MAITFVYNGSSQHGIHFQVDVLINVTSKFTPKEKLNGYEIIPFPNEISLYDHLWSCIQAMCWPNTSAMFENLFVFISFKGNEWNIHFLVSFTAHVVVTHSYLGAILGCILNTKHYAKGWVIEEHTCDDTISLEIIMQSGKTMTK